MLDGVRLGLATPALLHVTDMPVLQEDYKFLL